jgi:hypothetical protein
VLLTLAGTFLVVAASPCSACSCAPSTPKELLRRADAAFVGTVVAETMSETGTTQTFEVEGVYRGELGPTVEVWAQIGTSVVNTCAVLFPVGDRVAVLLERDERGRWQTSACSIVEPSDLEALAGPVRPPGAASTSPDGPASPGGRPSTTGDEEGLPAWAVIVIGAGLALAAIGGQVAWAARRDRRERRVGADGPVVGADGVDEVAEDGLR